MMGFLGRNGVQRLLSGEKQQKTRQKGQRYQPF
jgi:hypothetical protein